MNKTLIIAIAVVVCVGLAFLFLRNIFKPAEETTTIYCGANNSLPAIVFKNPTTAFPAFATEYTSKITANISVMDSLAKISSGSGAGSIDLSSKIVALRDKLSNESIRMELLLKGNFFAYNSKPCDSSVSRKYFDFLAIMADKNAELEKLKAELTTVPPNGGGDSAQLTVIKDTVKINQALSKFVKRYDFQKTASLLGNRVDNRIIAPRIVDTSKK